MHAVKLAIARAVATALLGTP